LKIASVISIPNLVKIAPASVNERENFYTSKVGRRACALHKSVLNVNGKLMRHLSGSQCSKFGEDRLKIEGARDY